MNQQDILNKVQQVIREELDLPNLIINEETNAYQIPEWDSLAHIQLVIGVENAFNIQFTSREIGSYKNVGEMCLAIETKLKC